VNWTRLNKTLALHRWRGRLLQMTVSYRHWFSLQI